jgi:hypothetical protein
LTAGDVHIEEGVATIRSPAGEWTIAPDSDVVLCGPCAVVRWLKVLDLAVTKPSTKTIARALKKAPAVDHRSSHVCQAGPVLGEATRGVPLLPPIDQWGALPLPLRRLSPEKPADLTRASASAYDAADAAAAWERRRRDLDDLAGIIDVLTDVERRADELNRRAAELVDEWL